MSKKRKNKLYRSALGMLSVNKFIKQLVNHGVGTSEKFGPVFAYFELLKFCKKRVDFNQELLPKCFDEIEQINKKLEQNPNIYNTGELYESDAR
jgi:hypothetical protein